MPFAPTTLNTTHTNDIKFWFVYLISIIFTFQTLLVAYSSSTYIEDFIAPERIGLLYSLGALGSMLLFFGMPYVLRSFGNVAVVIALMLGSMVTLGLIGLGLTPLLTITAFVLFLVLNPLIYLNIDVFSETLIGTNEGGTGQKRGLALSLMSGAALLAPLSMALIVGGGNNLAQLYFVSIGVGLVFVVLIIGTFRHFFDPPYRLINTRALLRNCWQDRNITVVLIAHFLLQIFFTWAVIYVPLFLSQEAGLPWSTIGTIIAVGLLGFVVSEYPTGILADKLWGEKEMMAVGFLILALASASISFMATASVLSWMLLMFISRVGAGLVETTTESYFFKKVNGEEANLMSLFRLMRPFATLIGALLGSLTLLVMPFALTFIILGFVMVFGIFLALYLDDTK